MDAGKFYGRHNAVDNENQASDSSTSCAGSDEESNFSPDELGSSSSDDEVSEAENDVAEDARQCASSSQPPQRRIDEHADNWTSVMPTNRQYAFTGNESIAISKRSGDDFLPHEIYHEMITDEILDMIVEETNAYAATYISNTTLTRKSRANLWHPTTRDEIKKFLAIVMCMGVVSLPNIYSYWSNKGIYLYKYFRQAMKRDRFQLLLKFLHFSDNLPMSSTDRLYKLRPLVEKLLKNYQKLYTPGSSMVIDETLVPFRGMLQFKQYIPGKAHKYGCKLYKLCTPDAYTWNLQLYVGKHPQILTFGHADSISITLFEGLLGCGRTLFGDNFYSSVPLAEHLLENKTYYCGTLRKNRKHCPKVVTEARVKTGSIISRQNEKGVKVFNWRDKRNVLMLSTIPEHSSDLKSTGKKNRKGTLIMKPQPVIDYNAAKKGVDMSDQMTSYQTALRKTRKWYRKVAFELLTGTTVVNAWV